MTTNSEVRVIVLRTAGTNCNEETAFAFSQFGARVDQVHIKQLINHNVSLHDYHILALPGGFSYGDDIASGKILANELRIYLGRDIDRFISDGKLIIGICNGFQVLVKAGILPGGVKANGMTQEATLTLNDSAKFESRWIYLKISQHGPWTRDLKPIICLPVAHGEGKFLTIHDNVLKRLNMNHQVVFRYCDPVGEAAPYPFNPNGSLHDVAGMTDTTGQILGLMPHPERHLFSYQHPSWTRDRQLNASGDGAKIFQNGIEYIQKSFFKTSGVKNG